MASESQPCPRFRFMPDSTPQLTPLPCCIEAPTAFVAKAQYALRMLLLPLGLKPTWIDKEALTRQSLYYGPVDTHAGEALMLRLHAQTAYFFDAGEFYPPEQVQWETWEGEQWPVLFPGTQGERGDVVASAFFWLSGWQEHVTMRRDRHGRFPHAASLQAHWGTTTRPAVDAYREWLATDLDARDVALQRRQWQGASWAFCPTHDIDYLKKWRKGMVYRETVEYLLRNFRHESLGQRLRRFAAFLKDWLRPGDRYRYAFERMHDEVKQRGGKATFFLKTGAHGTHDVRSDYRDSFLAERISALQEDGFEIGLHPSYYAHNHAFYLHDERDRLAELMEKKPLSVRQHYLRYAWPTTPRLHEAVGFQVDSSLGFAEHEGFRHATCHPFQVFDIVANRPLDVWEMPLAVMESALFNRRYYTPEQALEATLAILTTCQRFGGVAVMLWHNVLWDEMDHPGWGDHFISTLDAAVERKAQIMTLRDALDMTG